MLSISSPAFFSHPTASVVHVTIYHSCYFFLRMCIRAHAFNLSLRRGVVLSSSHQHPDDAAGRRYPSFTALTANCVVATEASTAGPGGNETPRSGESSRLYPRQQMLACALQTFLIICPPTYGDETQTDLLNVPCRAAGCGYILSQVSICRLFHSYTYTYSYLCMPFVFSV